jgi:hypothetical protein
VSTTNKFRDKSLGKLVPLVAARRSLAGRSFPTIVLIATILGAFDLRADDQRSSTVGMPARIDQITMAGSELEAIPLEDERAPIVLRITGTFPRDTAFLYDIQYYGLEAGEFDLMDYLRRKDRSSKDELEPLMVTINSVLPPGQIKPHVLAANSSPYLGGYWFKLAIGCVAWLAGFVAIICWMVVDRAKQLRGGASERQATLAERLRPIVQDAIAGKINETQLASLERMLIAFWRKQLKLDDATAVDAIVALRKHPEAGALLEQLELWLHRPGDTGGEVNVAELLKPYQNLPADALEM